MKSKVVDKMKLIKSVEVCFPDMQVHKTLQSGCSVHESVPHDSIRDIVLASKPSFSAFEWVKKANVFVMTKSFADLFKEDIEQSFTIGEVFSPSGVKQEDYVTLTFKQMIIVRGLGKGTYHKGFCPTCGLPMYGVISPFYVLKQSLTDAKMHVVWQMSALLVSKELAARVDKKKFKGIRMFDVLVYDEPQDDFDLPLVIKPE